MRKQIALLPLVLLLQASVQEMQAALRPADVANAAYGPHQRNVLDLWKAKSDKPTPLVIFIHGGGFTQGDKSGLSPVLLDDCLRHGISVAAINYRYSTQAPYPAPMMDSARAVQYLRQHAKEWNLNPAAFVATGSSAGAGISLWLAFHDDLKQPKSTDPRERQSTRLSAVAVDNAQSTYDPRTIATLIDGETARIDALRLLFDVKEGDPLRATRAFPAYADASAVTHLSADDPPVLLHYARSNTPLPPANWSVGIHHPKLGYYLKDKMDKLGIECTVRVKDDFDGKPAGQREREKIEFFVRRLVIGGSPSTIRGGP
ncbi:MAG TPA: alpha/beta hydrolase [Bryobacteraceae bacterium]|nr:alpha/beta hydrolase [Bryobacteraceae bacterium]